MFKPFVNVEIYYSLQKDSPQFCNNTVIQFGRLEGYTEIIFHNWLIYKCITVGNYEITKKIYLLTLFHLLGT